MLAEQVGGYPSRTPFSCFVNYWIQTLNWLALIPSHVISPTLVQLNIHILYTCHAICLTDIITFDESLFQSPTQSIICQH
jgi:hypothetical protein